MNWFPCTGIKVEKRGGQERLDSSHAFFPFLLVSSLKMAFRGILKDDAVKVLLSICQQIWKTQQLSHGKSQLSFQSQRNTMPNNAQIIRQLHSSHMLGKKCSKFSKPDGISQARILEWVAISFSRGSSRPRDRIHISCTGRPILYRKSYRVH